MCQGHSKKPISQPHAVSSCPFHPALKQANLPILSTHSPTSQGGFVFPLVDPMAMTKSEDKMDREHHQLNGHEFEQIPGDSGGQRSLVGCSPQGH